MPQRIYDERLLGRKRMLYDPRDFKLSSYLTARDYERAQEIMVKEWNIDYLLDQGSTSHCVGFAWAHKGITRDEDLGSWRLKENDGHNLYYKACDIGGYPNTEEGSTTRDGAEAARWYHYVDYYAFADNEEVIKTWLLTRGSLITGIPWYSEMFSPDSDGLVHAKGYIAGGHEIEINKIDKNRGRVRVPNSWGGEWGDNGFCEITFDDYFGKLLNPFGDAATAVDNPPDTPPPEPPPEPEPGGCGKRFYFLKRTLLG